MAELFVRCPSCSADTAPGTAFCGNCGTRIPEAAAEFFMRCPSCSAQALPGTAFCANCGRQIAEAPAPAAPVPPARPSKQLRSPGVSAGACPNCGAIDRNQDGSCRACQPRITEQAVPVSTPPSAPAVPTRRPESTVAASGTADLLPEASIRTRYDAMPADPPPVRHDAVPDPTLAFEHTAGTAHLPAARRQDSEQLPHQVNDRREKRPILGRVAIIAVPLLLGALGVGFGLTRNQDGSHQSGTPAAQEVPATHGVTTSTATPSSASSSSVPVKPVPPPAKAHPTTDPSLAQLQALVRGDASLAASKLDGRWVAFLASKTAGIVDPLQTTDSGGHKFGWSDILKEHERFRQDPRFASGVFLIMSTSFGSAPTVNGKPLFVTAVDNSSFSAADVRSWCDVTFAELPAAQRNNTCTPAQLTPHI